MGRSKETFGKKEVKKKQLKKRKDKASKRQEKREQKSNSFDDMIAYVDQNGQIISTPPDSTQREEIKAENIEVGIPKSEPGENNKFRTGKVVNYNESKGFGFISSPSLSESVFFHDTDCYEHLSVGNQVTFETEKGLKGLKAYNVKKSS